MDFFKRKRLGPYPRVSFMRMPMYGSRSPKLALYIKLLTCSDLNLERDRSKNAGNNYEYHTV